MDAAEMGGMRHHAKQGIRQGRIAYVLSDGASGIFDYDGYLAVNPDVYSSNIDPVDHWQKRGWKENRDICIRPSLSNPRACGQFDGTQYLTANPDVRTSRLKPEMHWAKHGMLEGRLGYVQGANGGGYFDPTSYEQQNAFPIAFTRTADGMDHWRRHGYKDPSTRMCLTLQQKSVSDAAFAATSAPKTSATSPPKTRTKFIYIADTYDVGTAKWNDTSTTQPGLVSGQVTKGNVKLNGHAVLQGTRDTVVAFPAKFDYEYTLVYVARYTNGIPQSDRGRIFQSSTPTEDWASGFCMGSSGVARHGDWITPSTDLLPDAQNESAWVMGVDTPDGLRVNGVQISSGYPSQLPVPSGVSINAGYASATENSAWDCAMVIICNYTMELEEIIATEGYILAYYGAQSFRVPQVSANSPQTSLYTVRNFAQPHTVASDLPDMPVNGTLTDCTALCTTTPGCIGFTRNKTAYDNDTSSCWLKKAFPSITANDPNFQTWVKPGTPFPDQVATKTHGRLPTISVKMPPDITETNMSGNIISGHGNLFTVTTSDGASRPAYATTNNGEAWTTPASYGDGTGKFRGTDVATVISGMESSLYGHWIQIRLAVPLPITGVRIKYLCTDWWIAGSNDGITFQTITYYDSAKGDTYGNGTVNRQIASPVRYKYVRLIVLGGNVRPFSERAQYVTAGYQYVMDARNVEATIHQFWMFAQPEYPWNIPASYLDHATGIYIGDSYDVSSSKWMDVSGNDNHAVGCTPNISFTPVSVTSSDANFGGHQTAVLNGTKVDSITFPPSLFPDPDNYTIFHVCKYSDANNAGRILTVTDPASSWTSGFADGFAGYADHGAGAVTDDNTTFRAMDGSNKYLMITDSADSFRINGQEFVKKPSALKGFPIKSRLAINGGYYKRFSSWSCMCVMVFYGMPPDKRVEFELFMRSRFPTFPLATYRSKLSKSVDEPASVALDAYGIAPIKGLSACFVADVFDDNYSWQRNDGQTCYAWWDISGNGKHAIVTCSGTNVRAGRAPKVASDATFGNNKVLQGNEFISVEFPSISFPDTGYTLVYVARYNPNGKKGTIFGEEYNASYGWHSGFSDGYTGTAKHGIVITEATPNPAENPYQWLIAVDQKRMYRVNGEDRTYHELDKMGSDTMVKNPGSFYVNPGNILRNRDPDHVSSYADIVSDWTISTILMFDHELTNAEILDVEKSLKTRYNTSFSRIKYIPRGLEDDLWKIGGLVGAYFGENFEVGRAVWPDVSDAGNHAVLRGNVDTTTIQTRKALRGNTDAGIVFPVSLYNTEGYTLIYVAGYAGDTSRQCIFQARKTLEKFCNDKSATKHTLGLVLERNLGTEHFDTAPSISVRYVMLQRNDNRNEYINITALVAYDENGAVIKEGVTPTLSPELPPADQFGPQYVFPDADRSIYPDALVHTDASPTAYVRLDLGRMRKVAVVAIVNRIDCCKARIVGTRLTLRDDQNQVVFQYDIATTTDKYIIPTSAPTPPPALPSNYVGCYADGMDGVSAMTEALGSGMTSVQQCIDLGKGRGYPYVGLQNNNECRGSKTTEYSFQGSKDIKDCRYQCTGTGGVGAATTDVQCGTRYANAVYKTGAILPSVKVRYVMLHRNDNRIEYINVFALVAYDENGEAIKDGVIPTVSSQYGSADQFGPQYVFLDANRMMYATSTPGALVVTNASPAAFVQLDLGRMRKVACVLVVNRHDCCKDRMVGTRLTLKDDQNQVVFQYDITTALDKYVIPTSAPTPPPPPPPALLSHYVGCYADGVSGVRTMTELLGSGMTSVQQCVDLGKSKGYPYVGLQNNNECWGSKTTTEYSSQGSKDVVNCRYQCTGAGGVGGATTDVQCGTGNVNAVYKTGATLSSASLRYVTLHRNDNRSEYINIVALVAYDENGAAITDGVTPSLSPQYGSPDQFGPQYVFLDADRSRYPDALVVTNASPTAYVQLDLGRMRKVRVVLIVNRPDCCKDRIVGTRLTLKDDQNQMVLQYDITTALDRYLIPTSAPTPPPALPTLPRVSYLSRVATLPPIASVGQVYANMPDWFSGFANNQMGVAYHGGWITDASGNGSVNSAYVLGVDTPQAYRANRKAVGSVTARPAYLPSKFAINPVSADFASQWTCAAVMVYNRILTADEISKVETVLFSRYDNNGATFTDIDYIIGYCTLQNVPPDGNSQINVWVVFSPYPASAKYYACPLILVIGLLRRSPGTVKRDANMFLVDLSNVRLPTVDALPTDTSIKLNNPGNDNWFAGVPYVFLRADVADLVMLHRKIEGSIRSTKGQLSIDASTRELDTTLLRKFHAFSSRWVMSSTLPDTYNFTLGRLEKFANTDTEIETFVNPSNYIGCFNDGINDVRAMPVSLGSGFKTVPDCLAAARRQNLPFAALQNYHECWGGADTSYASQGKVDDASCMYTCSGNPMLAAPSQNVQCGARKTNAVYTSGVTGSATAMTVIKAGRETYDVTMDLKYYMGSTPPDAGYTVLGSETADLNVVYTIARSVTNCQYVIARRGIRGLPQWFFMSGITDKGAASDSYTKTYQMHNAVDASALRDAGLTANDHYVVGYLVPRNADIQNPIFWTVFVSKGTRGTFFMLPTHYLYANYVLPLDLNSKLLVDCGVLSHFTVGQLPPFHGCTFGNLDVAPNVLVDEPYMFIRCDQCVISALYVQSPIVLDDGLVKIAIHLQQKDFASALVMWRSKHIDFAQAGAVVSWWLNPKPRYDAVWDDNVVPRALKGMRLSNYSCMSTGTYSPFMNLFDCFDDCEDEDTCHGFELLKGGGRNILSSVVPDKPLDVNQPPMCMAVANFANVADGLVGLYLPESYDDKTNVWRDLSGHDNDARVIGSTLTVSVGTDINLRPALSGDVTASVKFPQKFLNHQYTIVHVCRYHDFHEETANRIVAADGTWYSGFNSLLDKNCAQHGDTTFADKATLNPQWNYVDPYDFRVCVDQTARFRCNRKDVPIAGGSAQGAAPVNLGINTAQPPTSWMCACFLVYERELTDAEIETVEAYIVKFYSNSIIPGNKQDLFPPDPLDYYTEVPQHSYTDFYVASYLHAFDTAKSSDIGMIVLTTVLSLTEIGQIVAWAAQAAADVEYDNLAKSIMDRIMTETMTRANDTIVQSQMMREEAHKQVNAVVNAMLAPAMSAANLKRIAKSVVVNMMDTFGSAGKVDAVLITAQTQTNAYPDVADMLKRAEATDTSTTDEQNSATDSWSTRFLMTPAKLGLARAVNARLNVSITNFVNNSEFLGVAVPSGMADADHAATVSAVQDNLRRATTEMIAVQLAILRKNAAEITASEKSILNASLSLNDQTFTSLDALMSQPDYVDPEFDPNDPTFAKYKVGLDTAKADVKSMTDTNRQQIQALQSGDVNGVKTLGDQKISRVLKTRRNLAANDGIAADAVKLKFMKRSASNVMSPEDANKMRKRYKGIASSYSDTADDAEAVIHKKLHTAQLPPSRAMSADMQTTVNDILGIYKDTVAAEVAVETQNVYTADLPPQGIALGSAEKALIDDIPTGVKPAEINFTDVMKLINDSEQKLGNAAQAVPSATAATDSAASIEKAMGAVGAAKDDTYLAKTKWPSLAEQDTAVIRSLDAHNNRIRRSISQLDDINDIKVSLLETQQSKLPAADVYDALTDRQRRIAENLKSQIEKQSADGNVFKARSSGTNITREAVQDVVDGVGQEKNAAEDFLSSLPPKRTDDVANLKSLHAKTVEKTSALEATRKQVSQLPERKLGPLRVKYEMDADLATVIRKQAEDTADALKQAKAAAEAERLKKLQVESEINARKTPPDPRAAAVKAADDRAIAGAKQGVKEGKVSEEASRRILGKAALDDTALLNTKATSWAKDMTNLKGLGEYKIDPATKRVIENVDDLKKKAKDLGTRAAKNAWADQTAAGKDVDTSAGRVQRVGRAQDAVADQQKVLQQMPNQEKWATQLKNSDRVVANLSAKKSAAISKDAEHLVDNMFMSFAGAGKGVRMGGGNGTKATLSVASKVR